MKEELKDIKKGATWQNIYETLWHIATVRYCTQEQLKTAFPKNVWRRKCATPKKIKIMVEAGYLKQSETDVITATHKTINLLKTYSDYNTDIIKLGKGEGGKDTLFNTEIFFQLMELPNFFAIFYPEFYEHPGDQHVWLVPDACLLLKDSDQIKMQFIEIERPKPDWEKHLWGKKLKYEKIAQDINTWNEWWRYWSKVLKINLCPIEDFGFSIWCVGSDSFGWPGWKFSNL